MRLSKSEDGAIIGTTYQRGLWNSGSGAEAEC